MRKNVTISRSLLDYYFASHRLGVLRNTGYIDLKTGKVGPACKMVPSSAVEEEVFRKSVALAWDNLTDSEREMVSSGKHPCE